jgi:hypothetical protein
VFGYFVYRASDPSGPFVRLNSEPIIGTQFIDVTVGAGQIYQYWVTAINSDTSESLFSSPVSVTIPIP